jgi:hypothetical protein
MLDMRKMHFTKKTGVLNGSINTAIFYILKPTIQKHYLSLPFDGFTFTLMLCMREEIPKANWMYFA